MKKIFLSLFSIAAIMFAFTSCEDDQVTPLDTETTTVEYTVLVVNGSVATKSTNGLSGAEVSVSYGGKTRKATTGESGQATFSGIKPGAIAVSVMKESFLSAHFIADVKPTNITGDDYGNISGHSAASKIVLIPADSLTATIKGEVTANLNDTLPEFTDPDQDEEDAANVMLIARITGTPAIATDIGSDGAVSGLTYDGGTFTTTTNGSGEYSFTVPAAIGGVTYTIVPQDFTANRVVNDSVTLRTEYSIGLATSTTVYPGGTNVVDFDY
jgi:hypothetical protein